MTDDGRFYHKALEETIYNYLEVSNRSPKPAVLTRNADEILTTIARFRISYANFRDTTSSRLLKNGEGSPDLSGLPGSGGTPQLHPPQAVPRPGKEGGPGDGRIGQRAKRYQTLA